MYVHSGFEEEGHENTLSDEVQDYETDEGRPDHLDGFVGTVALALLDEPLQLLHLAFIIRILNHRVHSLQ